MSVKILKAHALDAVELAYIKQNAWKSGYNSFLPRDYIDSETDFEQSYFNFQNILLHTSKDIYIVKFNNIAIGIFELAKGTDTDIEGNACQLVYVYLLPEYWDKGFGKRIFRNIRKFTKADKYEMLYLWNFTGNTRADAFFKKCGFVSDGATKRIDIGNGRYAEKYRMVRKNIQSSSLSSEDSYSE